MLPFPALHRRTGAPAGSNSAGRSTAEGSAAFQVSTDTALQCLFRLGIQRSRYVELDAFKRQHGLAERVDLARLPSFAPNFGVELERRQLDWPALLTGGFGEPVMLALDNASVVLVMGVQRGEADRLAVVDPLTGRDDVVLVDRAQLEGKWSGTALVAKALPVAGDQRMVGFGWFFAKIFAERRALTDILIAAVAIHVLALAVPIYFQILIDKVVPNYAIATLYVLVVGMVIVIAFDAVFVIARNYLLAHIQRKVDFVISCDTVQHLLSLPISYFNETPAGVVAHTVQEATNVREFLTGRLANSFLDLLGIFLFLPLLAIYSWQLTLLVMMFSAVSFVILGILSRSYRRQVQALTLVEGERKALLVEITHGISTIKTLAVEPACAEKWRRYSQASGRCLLALGRTSANARAILGGLERTLIVAVGGFGVLLVLNDYITVGALVAFNMIGLRVSTPLIQAGSLLQDLQKATTSLNILRQLMERAPEPQTGQLTPTLKGSVEFENVTFYYPGTDRPALRNLSFRIEPGQTIGIVGRSGSGKTTVTRLIQGLYMPQSGLVTLDGNDVKEINLAHLRSQIGVVLQDNFLFRGSVRENIAIKKPHAALEEIVHVAHLAGAHEFIQRLRHGYSTELEEGAVNLSGGQQQRLAIARALLSDPRILVFDEATSALDPESEAIIQSNLQAISRGRTIILVTHRLSFVRNANQILVLDNGVLTSAGPHETVVEKDPVYYTLWRQQARSFRDS
jgi:ATP-binding cassette, subfamily B, bacterial HlyB/CyaB